MTNEKLTAESIDALATEWVSRRDRGSLDAQAQAELTAWLASDARCQGALARAEAAWALLDRAQALVTPGQPLPVQATANNGSRRRLVFGGIAAALIAGVAVVSGLHLSAERYETKVGEIRNVPLSDGSRVAINTDTRLTVAMQSSARRVRLDQGEAWFQVAKDASRPFVVEAGKVRVRAVGTAFSVRRTGAGVDVLVTEGVVKTWVGDDDSATQSLAAGAHAFVDMSEGMQRMENNAGAVERALAWRDRKIDLNGVTLAQAAVEFNRYNTRKLVIDDPVLAAEPLVGRFEIDAVQTFAHGAAGLLGARIEESDQQIRLVRSPR